MPLAADDKRHRLANFQRGFEALLGLFDADREAAVTPLNAGPKAVPARRQFRVEFYAVAFQ